MRATKSLTDRPSQAVRERSTELVGSAEQTANRVDAPLSGHLPLGEFIRRTAEEAHAHHLLAFAGSLAFRSLLAIIPSLIALLWLLTALHARQLTDTLLELAGAALPQSALDPIRTQVTNPPPEQARGGVTFAAFVSCVVALAALASTFLCTMEAMNVIYGVEERRSFPKRYLQALLLSLAVTALLLGALVVILFGERLAVHVGDAAGSGTLVRWAWTLVTWPVLVAGVFAAFGLAYYFAPDRDQRVRWVSRGTVIAVAFWLLFTLLFSLYVNHVRTYSATYGALAGIALFMLYQYCTSFILLLGAEMNQVIEAHGSPGAQAERRAA